MDTVPEPQWVGLCAHLKADRGVALLLGATDSGKSTLAGYLIRALVSGGTGAALVDSDVGQSSLALPGTISKRVFSNPEDLEDFRFDEMSFVGITNPARNISLMIAETQKMVDRCSGRADIILVDTTGLVSEGIGTALKVGKIRALRPKHIIAVQREQELERILSQCEADRVHLLRASLMAGTRSRAYRSRYRRRKFEEYFVGPKLSEFLLVLQEVRVLHHGHIRSPERAELRENMVIGLNHDDLTLALGVVTETDHRSITFRSPIKSLAKVNRVVTGDISL